MSFKIPSWCVMAAHTIHIQPWNLAEVKCGVGTMEPRSPRMQTLRNIDAQKHTETKKKMFRHQWGSFFFPPAQSQLTSCQAEWPPPLVASYFTATSALLFPFYHVMARFHYKYISWNRKLKQPLLLGVFWESCCIFCGLRSSKKRNPIKRHRGSHMIQSIADV